MSDLVTVTDDGPVRTVRMNRPDKKNALTFAMYDAMAAAIESAQDNPAIRCLLIAGGERDFCAGNDIGNFVQTANDDGALRTPVIRFLHVLAHCEKPLVAAVQGNAVGIGTTMLLHCDHVVASSAGAARHALRRPRHLAGSGFDADRAAADGPLRAPSRCW